MKKIPSIFQRDWEDDPDKLLPIPMPECDWVFKNEGVATRKWDGTACMIKDFVLYKRFDAKKGQPAPPGGIACQEPDPITGHHPYWIPVDFNQPENWMHTTAFLNVYVNAEMIEIWAKNKDHSWQDSRSMYLVVNGKKDYLNDPNTIQFLKKVASFFERIEALVDEEGYGE